MVIMNAATSVITTRSPYIARVSMTIPQVSAPMAEPIEAAGLPPILRGGRGTQDLDLPQPEPAPATEGAPPTVVSGAPEGARFAFMGDEPTRDVWRVEERYELGPEPDSPAALMVHTTYGAWRADDTSPIPFDGPFMTDKKSVPAAGHSAPSSARHAARQAEIVADASTGC